MKTLSSLNYVDICLSLNRSPLAWGSQRATDLLDWLPDQWVSAATFLGSTTFHLESVSDSQSERKFQGGFTPFAKVLFIQWLFSSWNLQVKNIYLFFLNKPILVKIQQTEDLLCAERKQWLVWLLLFQGGGCCLALHQTLKLSQLHNHTTLLLCQKAGDLWQKQDTEGRG